MASLANFVVLFARAVVPASEPTVRIFPDTSNEVPGLAVPMPMLPLALISMLLRRCNQFLRQTNSEITNYREIHDDDHKRCDVKLVLGVSYSILILSVLPNQEDGAPGAIPTRDLPLRSQCKGVYLSYLRVSPTA